MMMNMDFDLLDQKDYCTSNSVTPGGQRDGRGSSMQRWEGLHTREADISDNSLLELPTFNEDGAGAISHTRALPLQQWEHDWEG